MARRKWLHATARAASEAFGYEEYEAPILELLDLYAAKSGEELVREQAFVFQDRGGKMVALRPELTPSLARMVAQRQNELAFPLRWWSYGPFWRYERPQKGRTREFFQWNIDLIGVNTPEADAELAAVAARFFHLAGLSPADIRIQVNNRRLMDAQFERIGIPPANRPAVLHLIDRRDKMPAEAWQAYALEKGLTPAQFAGLCAVLENTELWRESEELTRFFAAAQALGAGDYVESAPHIIRGLAYYTGTVFEARDRDGEFRAILGGGRYDNLVGDVGGQPLPGVGFAMGDKVIQLVLEKYGKLPTAADLRQPPILVTVFDEGSLPGSLGVASRLRAAGFKVAAYPEPAKLGKQFKYADRIGARLAVVYGPEEQAKAAVTIKDLRTGEQQTVPQADAAAAIRAVLEMTRP
jgi:histidyl-tRNA synthetase